MSESKGVALHVEYLLWTQPQERQQQITEALLRNVPGHGGEVMNYVQQMVNEGWQKGIREGRQEGELRGQLQTIQGFLERAVPWSTIEAATGIDEAAFRRLKQQLDDNGAGHAN